MPDMRVIDTQSLEVRTGNGRLVYAARRPTQEPTSDDSFLVFGQTPSGQIAFDRDPRIHNPRLRVDIEIVDRFGRTIAPESEPSFSGTLAPMNETRAVEAVTFRVRVRFVRPGVGEETGIETVTFINTSAIHGDLETHARDEAANRLYDRYRDVTILSTEIVS